MINTIEEKMTPFLDDHEMGKVFQTDFSSLVSMSFMLM